MEPGKHKPLEPGDSVWITDMKYIVESNEGRYRRNRRHLTFLHLPVTEENTTTDDNPPLTLNPTMTDTSLPSTCSKLMYTTRSGRTSKQLDRFEVNLIKMGRRLSQNLLKMRHFIHRGYLLNNHLNKLLNNWLFAK